jgi:lauroyl/myristoyl acyltransferase
VDVPFLGTMLRCYPTIGVLAARYGADVAVFTCDRVPRERFRFELRCHAVVDTSTQVQTEDHGAITVQCMRELERAILARPEQYLWTRGWVGS